MHRGGDLSPNLVSGPITAGLDEHGDLGLAGDTRPIHIQQHHVLVLIEYRHVYRTPVHTTPWEAGQCCCDSVAFTVMSTPARARDTGQAAPTRSAASRNAASSMPGTFPVSVSCEVVIVGAPDASSRVTVALTSRCAGGCPSSVSRFANAMEKQDEWAAATSSSGLV